MQFTKEYSAPPKIVADSVKLMRLLILVNEFERDVADIRKEFGVIKNPGATWMDRFENIQTWFAQRNRPIFTYISHEPPLKFDGSDPYYQAITETGMKFNLPPDFYCDAHSGISALILTDWITISSRDWNIVRDSAISRKKGALARISPVDDRKIFLVENIVDIRNPLPGLEDEKPTIADVAEEFGITAVNARKIKERLSDLAKELFGYGIE